MKTVRECIKSTDWLYLLLCVLLSLISVVTLVSVGLYAGLGLGGTLGNWKPALTQALAMGLGIVAALVVSAIDHSLLLRYWPVHAALYWGLVLLTFVPGIGYEPAGTGSQSWIALPFGMSFQPTELAKISFILTFALHLQWAGKKLNHPKYLFPVLAHLAAPPLLVHFQGDDGTALVFLAIGLVMLVAAGLNRWVVAGGTAVVLAAAPIVWTRVMSGYQRERILGLFNPEPYADTIMYQQLQARQAVAAGGLAGRGLFQPQHTYVPRPENDFVFSWFAESCGFLGCLVLLGLLFALMGKTLHVAYATPSRAGTFICIGVFAMLFFQSLVNVGMNLMLLPVMGITLPFVSAGGTSMMALYLAVGLVLGISRGRRRPALYTT